MTESFESYLDSFLSRVRTVLLERVQEYGPPENSFRVLKSLWSGVLGQEVSASRTVLLLSLLKVSRLAWDEDQPDSWIDLAGYAAIGSYLESLEEG